MKNSAIEWTDHTFNPWWGCTKVSPGCANCYAEGISNRFRRAEWGPGKPRVRTSEATWKEPLKWNRDAPEFATCPCGFSGAIPFESSRCPKCQDSRPVYRRPRVFCASMADWLDSEVPAQWLLDLLELIHSTPHLDWQLLTKRPENWVRRIVFAINGMWSGMTEPDTDFYHWLMDWRTGTRAPHNVWIGTSAEDQIRYDERIGFLLDIPARVHFLSCEPLLEPINITANFALTGQARRRDLTLTPRGSGPKIDWVICGGESGPGARRIPYGAAQSLLDQCESNKVPFFFKQWGAFTSECRVAIRIGKKAAGRKLAGSFWNQFPEVAA
jgi:protein gp37